MDRAWIVWAIHVVKNLESALVLELRAGEVSAGLQNESPSTATSCLQQARSRKIGNLTVVPWLWRKLRFSPQ